MGPNYGNFFGHLGQSVKSRADVGCYVGIYALNSILVSRRPEMGMEFGSKKWNRGWTSGLPMDSPLLGFGIVKISPGLCEFDKNRPCVVCLNVEINGLSCVEIDRVVHEFNVLI